MIVAHFLANNKKIEFFHQNKIVGISTYLPDTEEWALDILAPTGDIWYLSSIEEVVDSVSRYLLK